MTHLANTHFASTMPADDFDDSLDDLLGGPIVGPAKTPPAHYKPIDYTEPCKKCGGTGRFRNIGPCFACQGKGNNTFKTAPQARARAQQTYVKKAADKRVAKQSEIETFKTDHADVWNWLAENDRLRGQPKAFEFALSLHDALHQYGHLTDKQLAAAESCVAKRAAKRAEWAAANAAKAEAAPTVDTAGVDRLKQAFDHAIAYSAAKGRGLKNPRITIGDMVISPAKETSKNPGALYVKAHEEYLGKIVAGRFHAVPTCTEVQSETILAFVADPKAAAEAYGIETGRCCICDRELTNKDSIALGIGPQCKARFGW